MIVMSDKSDEELKSCINTREDFKSIEYLIAYIRII
jgi:hypothetical protein